MNILLNQGSIKSAQHLSISGSKSETNRLLLLQAIFPSVTFQEGSDSEDSDVMQAALHSECELKEVHHAGTAMRFLTAFYATKPGVSVILKGSDRMHQRPIAILVDALRALGADIEYLGAAGFPPLKINGKKLVGGKLPLNAQVSSQFISALLMVGSQMEQGLQIQLMGTVTSRPYISMTIGLLSKLGLEISWNHDIITLSPQSSMVKKVNFEVESDWSSASYFYTVIAFSEIGTFLRLSSFKRDSLQADREVVQLFERLGVQTNFEGSDLILHKQSKHTLSHFTFDFQNCPDIAQTLAVACLGLGIHGKFPGLSTLKIKETDRIVALRDQMAKLGAEVTVKDDCLSFKSPSALSENVTIQTYNDHRMAMAFAPLAIKVPIQIADAKVVEKSYPLFWDHMKVLGFSMEEHDTTVF